MVVVVLGCDCRWTGLLLLLCWVVIVVGLGCCCCGEL